MKAADQRLDELVAKMNTAPGVEKMTATAAVATEMVTRRRTMREGSDEPHDGAHGGWGGLDGDVPDDGNRWAA